MFGIFKKKKAIHKGGAKARKADGSGAGEDSKLTPVDQVKESVLRKEDEKDKKQNPISEEAKVNASVKLSDQVDKKHEDVVGDKGKKLSLPKGHVSIVDSKEGQAMCPFLKMRKWPKPEMKKRIPVAVVNGTHVRSKGSSDLLKDIGGGDRLRRALTRFYEKAFEDHTLQKFMFEDDGAAAHGKRLADWIIEKMGGEGSPWTDSGRLGLRQVSHRQAWYSDKREPEKKGRRFKLDDCRIWMRLMFWACREEGIASHSVFFDWYIGFISHFIRVYERTAPPYTEESASWSADEANIKEYIESGRKMKDVIGYHVRYDLDSDFF